MANFCNLAKTNITNKLRFQFVLVQIGPNRFCFGAKFLPLLPTFRPDRLGGKNLDLGRKRKDKEEVDTKEIKD